MMAQADVLCVVGMTVAAQMSVYYLKVQKMS